MIHHLLAPWGALLQLHVPDCPQDALCLQEGSSQGCCAPWPGAVLVGNLESRGLVLNLEGFPCCAGLVLLPWQVVRLERALFLGLEPEGPARPAGPLGSVSFHCH